MQITPQLAELSRAAAAAYSDPNAMSRYLRGLGPETHLDITGITSRFGNGLTVTSLALGSTFGMFHGLVNADATLPSPTSPALHGIKPMAVVPVVVPVASLPDRRMVDDRPQQPTSVLPPSHYGFHLSGAFGGLYQAETAVATDTVDTAHMVGSMLAHLKPAASSPAASLVSPLAGIPASAYSLTAAPEAPASPPTQHLTPIVMGPSLPVAMLGLPVVHEAPAAVPISGIHIIGRTTAAGTRHTSHGSIEKLPAAAGITSHLMSPGRAKEELQLATMGIHAIKLIPKTVKIPASVTEISPSATSTIQPIMNQALPQPFHPAMVTISPFALVPATSYALPEGPQTFAVASEVASPFADVNPASYTIAMPKKGSPDHKGGTPVPPESLTPPGQLPFSIIPQMLPGASQYHINEYAPMILEALKQDGMGDGQMQNFAFATIAVEDSQFEPIPEYGANPSMNYWPYYGRGFIQLTGEENYRRCGEALGIDLVGHPDLALRPKIAVKVFAWFLKVHEQALREALDAGDLKEARIIVNGGLNGYRAFSDAWNIGEQAIEHNVDA